MQRSLTIAFLIPLTLFAATPERPLLAVTSVEGVRETFGRSGASRTLEIVRGAQDTTDGDGALRFGGTSVVADGNHYFGVTVPLAEPVDLREERLLFDARTNRAGVTQAFYVRCYNQGQKAPAWSFNSWNGQLRGEWRTFSLQTALCLDGLAWEATVVEDRVADRVDRIEFIIGTSEDETAVDGLVDNLRLAARLLTIQDLSEPKRIVRETVLVRDGQPEAVVLHPDSEPGRNAAMAVVAAVKEKTGIALPARPAVSTDREPDQTAILLGNVENNPAMLLLYARRLTPVDNVCPGQGGALVHTVFDPFGKGVNAVVVGATDDVGLERAAAAFAASVSALPQGNGLALPRLFERRYGEDFLARFGWADDEPDAKRLEQGIALGKRALDTGQHTSVAGTLAAVANRYQITGHSVEAKLYVALWDLYVESAVADPRKFGGPWGFDSDFPSRLVVPGWDVVEEDPGLTDDERLRATKAMARWLAEAVIPSCRGAASHTRVPHNHETFPGLGALYAGLYFTQGYEVLEGPLWLGIADAMFRRQAGYFKPYEDCNGYQWLTNGHLMRYSLARPHMDVFENGNGRKIIDYCLGTMDNLGYQVPYGDTGSWKCWNSEMICLDMFAFATGDRPAAWAATRKREIKNTKELYAFYRRPEQQRPNTYDGVIVWPLEPQFYESFAADPRPELERCFDKISFREAMDPDAAYLLLDGLSNGGHKHYDGNSLPRLTQFDRIWLADNDYYKSPVKFHNSLMVFKDGQSQPIPPYVELVGAGESQRYGYSRTRLRDYAGIDWDRTVVWLKSQGSFVVMDKLTAREASEYQFRVLWHGVGEPTLSEQGLLLEQKGPVMWIQVAPGPHLSVADDHELGKNWGGYAHAEPVVRSLSATATVRLEPGQSYLYATVFHGTPNAPAPAWRLGHMVGSDGVLLDTQHGKMAVGMGPAATQTPEGLFSSDCNVVVADSEGLSLLGATRADVNGDELHDSTAPECVDLPMFEVASVLDQMPVRSPTPNLAAGGDAPAHPVHWSTTPAPELLVLTGNKRLAGAVDLGVSLHSDPDPAEHNAFSPDGPNSVNALLDGQWANDTTTSVMYAPDRTVTLTIDLGAPCTISRIRWMQWWATTSSKKTSYLLGQATVTTGTDSPDAMRPLDVVTDDGPHPNFGLPIEYSVRGDDRKARWVGLTIEPKPGSAVYLAQVIVEGKPERDAAGILPYHFTRVAAGRVSGGERQDVLIGTGEGAVIVLNADGSQSWTHGFGCRINDLTAVDLDGDGKDEIAVARQDHFVSVLDDTGEELWKRELKLYRRPPYVNVICAGDLDGDGKPEVVAGGENWRFYAFAADGTELWNYESVHPSRAGAVADLDGDGKDEVICGTHYYWASVLNTDGTRRWRHSFGPICYDIATGSFDGDRTRGVLFAGGDGCLHYVAHDGKPRLKYNTGDEVRCVAAGDLDGDGRDEILAGSLSHSLYCFGADAQRRWRMDLGGAVTALAVVPRQGGMVAVAGTGEGRVASLAADGRLLASSRLGSPVVSVVAHGDAVVVGTGDGTLRRLAVVP